MGSWNHTCMISRMPVMAGEKVVSVFLAHRPPALQDDHRCYVHALFDPVPFLIYGEYNDYGAVENFTGPHDDLIVNWFKKNIVELEQGENPCHDIPVRADELNMDQLYEADHEGRLFVKFHYKVDQRPVDHVVIKQRLFDRILDDTMIETYSDGGYQFIKFKDLLYNINGAVAWLKEYWTEYDEKDESIPPAVRAVRMMASIRANDMDSLIHSTWNNTDVPPQCAWLREKEWHGLSDPFVEEFKAADFDRARTLLIERLKFSWLEAWLAYARHWWQVPGNVGGQEAAIEYHQQLATFMLEECKRITHRWDDVEEDQDIAADAAAG